MLTQQEIFDRVARHLIGQKHPSFDPFSKECLYRGPNGAKCAAGIFIPDHLYHQGLEGKSVNLLGRDVFPNVNVADADVRMLLRGLQSIHDDSVSRSDVEPISYEDEWRRRLKLFALDFNLSADLLDSI